MRVLATFFKSDEPSNSLQTSDLKKQTLATLLRCCCVVSQESKLESMLESNPEVTHNVH